VQVCRHHKRLPGLQQVRLDLVRHV
jgi:hypothetical protein